MKFAIIPVCLFCLLLSFSYGQEENTDSIFRVLNTIPEDSSKVDLMIDLSKQNCISNPDTAIYYAHEARLLAEKVDYQSGVALAYKYEGMVYYMQTELFETIQLWKLSLETFQGIGDKNGEANMRNNIGAIYFNQGNDVKAIENYLESLRVAEEISDTIRTLTALANIGTVYSNKDETRNKALEFYHDALPLSISIGDLTSLGTITVNMGQIFLETGVYDSALYYFERSLEAFSQVEGGNTPYPLTYIGEVYAKSKMYDQAIRYQQEAARIARERNAQRELAHALLGLAKTYDLKGDIPSALDAYLEARDIAIGTNSPYQLEEILDSLSGAYANLNNYRSAYENHLLLVDIKDRIYNIENSKSVERNQFGFDLEKKQSEINLLVIDKELQALQMERQMILKRAFLGGFILIFIIAFILFRNNRIKIKTNRLLGAQKSQIENLLLNILPAKVAEELQTFGFATPRYYKSVSVLFTDFKGFSRIAEGLTPNELVSELNEFFVAFDDIIERHDLEKIKTIGDAYMCAGGIPTENETHPLDVLKAGMEMQKYMDQKNTERVKNGKVPWGLRIGVHTGPIVAGVVGKKKYAYDIWGSTVNISSRMESNGEAGKLNVSSATFQLIKDYYSCEYRGKIHAKNIGDVDMYFVDGKISDIRDS